MDWLTQNLEPPSPATAYSYLRLSSKRQANQDDRKRYRDGHRRQIALRDAYLAENPHLTLDDRLILHDIGLSGFKAENVAEGGKLGLFLAEVKAGRIARGSYLLMESLDRMTRQQVSRAQALLLELVNLGVVVVSLTDNQTFRDTSHPTQFIIAIMSLSRAHEESVLKAKRLRETWSEKRRRARETPLSGRCPAWLDLVDGKFVPNGKVRLVKEILGYLADGWGRDRIARLLNERGDPPWGHGRSWHGGTVQKLTDNVALIGHFQPHRLVYEDVRGVMKARRVPDGPLIEDYFPRVVDDELWTLARAVAVKRRMGRAPNAGGRLGTKVSNLFGMVATCGTCGSPMNFRDRGERSTPILRCSAERGGACSNDYRIPYYDTENAILSWLVHLDMSGGAPGEVARLEGELRSAVAKRDDLQAQGETIVRQIGPGSRFAREPLAEIERDLTATEARMADLGARVAALKKSGGGDERRMAVAALIELYREGADDARIFAVRSRIRQIIRGSFQTMWCQPDGKIDIVTIDGSTHLFRDGYWWYEPDEMWVPWAGSMLGGGHPAKKAELARRAVWLEEARVERAAKRGEL